jgi:hypothetical protein
MYFRIFFFNISYNSIFLVVMHSINIFKKIYIIYCINNIAAQMYRPYHEIIIKFLRISVA